MGYIDTHIHKLESKKGVEKQQVEREKVVIVKHTPHTFPYIQLKKCFFGDDITEIV